LTGYPKNPSTVSISYSQVANPPLRLAGAEDNDAVCRHPNEYHRLVPIRTSGDRPPLFCIFPGPPGSSEFADILPEDQPLYDFYFSKLDGASNFPTVEQLALAYLEHIRKIQAHGPYQLCGYSKGGLVAYEIARLLLSEGENVSFLALFETWHPGYEQNLTRIELIRFRLMHIMDRLEKNGRNLLQGRFSDAIAVVWKAIAKRAKLFAWRVARRLFQRTNQAVPKGMQHVEAIVVLKSFVPKPYPKRFMLIRTDDPYEKKMRDPTLGWHVCAAEGVDVQFVHGDQDHGSMMNKPYVHGVMDKIIPYLAGPHRP
jgi:thioesterase domain-containing protein